MMSIKLSPEIEVLDSANPESGTQSVLITSDIGEMNNTSNEGYLSENVVNSSRPGNNTQYGLSEIFTRQKLVYTDDSVTINGKGVKITGQGCEIDLTNKKCGLKRMQKWKWTALK